MARGALGSLPVGAFILLNLVFSTQAAYAAPMILYSQKRSAEHDQLRAEHDHRTLADLAAGHTEALAILRRLDPGGAP